MSSRAGMAWSSEFLMSLKYPGLCSSRLAKSFWAAQRIWEWKNTNSVFCFLYIDLTMEKWQSWWKNLCWMNEWICDVYLNPGEPHAGFVKCLCHIQSISSIDFFNHFTGDTLYSLTQLPVENTVSLIKMLLLMWTTLIFIIKVYGLYKTY